MNYQDKNGVEIKVGDILRYQETSNDSEHYGKSLDLVVMYRGILSAVQKIGFPAWSKIVRDDTFPIALKFYGDSYNNNRLSPVEVIGNIVDNPERLSVHYAAKMFPKVALEVNTIDYADIMQLCKNAEQHKMDELLKEFKKLSEQVQYLTIKSTEHDESLIGLDLLHQRVADIAAGL